MAQLQVGDKVHIDGKWNERIVTIDRVTDKRAFSGTMQFNREYEKSITMFGLDKWDTTTCRFATPEIVAQVRHKAAKAKAYNEVKNADIRHLALDQLNAILNIIKPQTNGTI